MGESLEVHPLMRRLLKTLKGGGGGEENVVLAGRKLLQTVGVIFWQELHTERRDLLVRPYLKDLSGWGEAALPSGAG